MIEIHLGNSPKIVLIDDADGDLRHDKWFIESDGYVRRTTDHKPLAHCVAENMAMVLKDKLDHADGDTLNNCRSNLRPATNAESNANRGKPLSKKPPTSKYKGVRWVDKAQKWKVQIQVNGKHKHIAMCVDEDDAARRYNRAAKMYHGAFARLNILPDAPPS